MELIRSVCVRVIDNKRMRLQELGQMVFKAERYRGSVIMLVLIVLTMTMLEIAMLSLILTRSLGDKGVLLTQDQVARRGTETALTRISNSLSAYLAASGTTNVDTAFAAGGSNDIENVALTATDPEDSSADATNVTISA
jgi:Tfp pilus assembly PilM family ATPase